VARVNQERPSIARPTNGALGGFGGEFGIVPLAPTLARGQIDLLCPEHTPDLPHIDIADGFGGQRPSPPPVTVRRQQVENTQNAPPRLGCVFGVLPRLAVSSRPANRCSAYRTRHFDAVPVVQPALRPIARVDIPAAASSTIRARWRKRCSVFPERTKPSSSTRSASVMIGLASRMRFIATLNHDSRISDSLAPLHLAFGDLGADIERDREPGIGIPLSHCRDQSRAVGGLAHLLLEGEEVVAGVDDR
jgi:hypothetical protein